jgi:hypothetical protein
MKAKFLLPLVLGLLAFSMPTWAESAAPAGAVIDNSNALAPYGPDAQSIASLSDFPGRDFSDTIPLFTLYLSRPNLTMGIAFLAQETVVGPNSVDGAGVMLTFKAANP